MSSDYAIAVRFGDSLLDYGFTSIPNLLLFNYNELGITNQELVFILHLLSFWWGREKPFPALSTIAARMGVSWLSVHRYSQSLKTKGLLLIRERYTHGGKQLTNEYDFTPLLTALKEAYQI